MNLSLTLLDTEAYEYVVLFCLGCVLSVVKNISNYIALQCAFGFTNFMPEMCTV